MKRCFCIRFFLFNSDFLHEAFKALGSIAEVISSVKYINLFSLTNEHVSPENEISILPFYIVDKSLNVIFFYLLFEIIRIK